VTSDEYRESADEQGLVSVIVPVHNRATLLAEAVGSVLAQTYHRFEIIIVDDGSDDGTTSEAADDLARAYPAIVRVVHQTNTGVGPAREAARLLARGEFIQYLDSDDRLLPRKLEVQVAALRAAPHAGVAYGMTRLIDRDGRQLEAPYKGSGECRRTLFPALLIDRWWNTHTPLYRRSVCDAAGPWSAMRSGEDWEYDARVGALGTQLVFCDEYVSEHRAHGGPRLSGSPSMTREHAREWAQLLPALAQCAVTAGVQADAPEMLRLARHAFLLARQAGAAGHGVEAAELFAFARQIQAASRTRSFSLWLYGLVATGVGWVISGRFAGMIDWWRDAYRRREPIAKRVPITK
jgi:hypothetical protein